VVISFIKHLAHDNSFANSSIHHVSAKNPKQAVKIAGREALKSDPDIDPECVTVFAGHHDSIRWY